MREDAQHESQALSAGAGGPVPFALAKGHTGLRLTGERRALCRFSLAARRFCATGFVGQCFTAPGRISGRLSTRT